MTEISEAMETFEKLTREEKCFQIAKNLGLNILNNKVQVPVNNWFKCRKCAFSSSNNKRSVEHSKTHDGYWQRGVSINYIAFESYPEFVEYVEV